MPGKQGQNFFSKRAPELLVHRYDDLNEVIQDQISDPRLSLLMKQQRGLYHPCPI
jgi:hypothetical protein